jgi:hypothetical protein
MVIRLARLGVDKLDIQKPHEVSSQPGLGCPDRPVILQQTRLEVAL